MRRTRTLALVAALVIVAVAGCGSGTKPIEHAAEPVAETTIAPTTSASTTAPTAPQSDEEAVLAAVQGYWDTFLAANNPPDPNHPDLAKYYTGDALLTSSGSIVNRQRLGQAIRLPESTRFNSNASVVEISDTAATVSDCLVDDSILVDQATDKILNDAVSTSALTIIVSKDAGVWKVAEVHRSQKWEGVAGCAER